MEAHLLLLVSGEYITLILFAPTKPAHMDITQSHEKDKHRKENQVGKNPLGENKKKKGKKRIF